MARRVRCRFYRRLSQDRSQPTVFQFESGGAVLTEASDDETRGPPIIRTRIRVRENANTRQVTASGWEIVAEGQRYRVEEVDNEDSMGRSLTLEVRGRVGREAEAPVANEDSEGRFTSIDIGPRVSLT